MNVDRANAVLGVVATLLAVFAAVVMGDLFAALVLALIALASGFHYQQGR